MDITVGSKFADTSEQEIVVFVMGIGGQRRGRMIRDVEHIVRERAASHEGLRCRTESMKDDSLSFIIRYVSPFPLEDFQ